MRAVRVLALVLLVSPASALAQERPELADGSRVFVDVNLSGAASSVSQTRQFAGFFVKFGEIGSSQVAYPKPSGATVFPLLDVGAGVRVGPYVGAGIGFSRTRFKNSVNITTTVPHPLFYQASATGAGPSSERLTREEAAIHMFLVGRVPFPMRRTELRISGGPSFFWFKADMVQEVLVAQEYNAATPASTVTVQGVVSEQARDDHPGFHAGADLTFVLAQRVGLGFGLRYSQATVAVAPEPLSKIRQKLRVGSTQGFVGLRLRFGR